MKTKTYLPSFGVLLSLCLIPAGVDAQSDIVNTKHNLSVSGPGEVKALTETRICVFCHTPHNATPSTPLWNREIKPVNYNTYLSSTMRAEVLQPNGPTRLCLSCHDGTIALGNVLSVPGGIKMSDEIRRGRRSYLGTDLTDDHPVSFPYNDSLPNEELASTYPADLEQYAGSYIHCTTCHNPHSDRFGKFLVASNRFSELCIKCHLMNGWALSAHGTSNATWNGTGENPWTHTEWKTVVENGCENCHAPHNAGGPLRLMNHDAEEDNCYVCHNGSVVPAPNVKAEMNKFSSHPVQATQIGLTANFHDPAEDPLFISRHVECADCHEPHGARKSGQRAAPFAGAATTGVSGVNTMGTAEKPARKEYEICFKCHGDANSLSPRVERYLDTFGEGTNTRKEFDPANVSYHPVVEAVRNDYGANPPSLPNVQHEPNMTSTTIIFCTDCHDSDKSPAVGGIGPRGPHGSKYSPILRQEYITLDGVGESEANYALCYWCHDRQKILADRSFQKKGLRGGHANHLTGHGKGTTKSAPCSVCHDPHGVSAGSAMDGSDHTHLISFDRLVVQPAAGQNFPIFKDRGMGSGSCTLSCHGFTHTNDNSRYP